MLIHRVPFETENSRHAHGVFSAHVRLASVQYDVLARHIASSFRTECTPLTAIF